MQRNTPRMPWRRNYVFLCQFYPLQTIFQFTEDRKLITDISSKFQQLWGFKVLKNKQGGAGYKLPPRLALPLQTASILLGKTLVNAPPNTYCSRLKRTLRPKLVVEVGKLSDTSGLFTMRSKKARMVTCWVIM